MTTTYWSQPSWVDKSQDCWLVKFENYSEGIGKKKDLPALKPQFWCFNFSRHCRNVVNLYCFK